MAADGEILLANAALYAAFRARDSAAMGSVRRSAGVADGVHAVLAQAGDLRPGWS